MLNNKNTLTLYHGSRYLFDKFSMDKVNTGQHSQDFGYGLYFTSDKSVAAFYANELSNTVSPVQKYDAIIKTNERNDILHQYLRDNRLVSAKRVLNGLISDGGGNVDEWRELLKELDVVHRYGYLYTVRIDGGNFISKDDYTALKYGMGLDDREMNKVLSGKGYNGIKYRINSRGLNTTQDFTKGYNVVITDAGAITIIDVERIWFEGLLRLEHI